MAFCAAQTGFFMHIQAAATLRLWWVCLPGETQNSMEPIRADGVRLKQIDSPAHLPYNSRSLQIPDHSNLGFPEGVFAPCHCALFKPRLLALLVTTKRYPEMTDAISAQLYLGLINNWG